MTILLAVSLAAGFGSRGATAVAGTPPGTYTVTVTASYTPTASGTAVVRGTLLMLVV